MATGSKSVVTIYNLQWNNQGKVPKSLTTHAWSFEHDRPLEEQVSTHKLFRVVVVVAAAHAADPDHPQLNHPAPAPAQLVEASCAKPSKILGITLDIYGDTSAMIESKLGNA